MIPKKIKDRLESQHYSIVGNHSAVQVCGWTKKSLRDEGYCYKEKFYGIESHKCCQMSPNISCPNRCLHCWRPMKIIDNLSFESLDEPEDIIKGSIKSQIKLLSGFKGSEKTNLKKFEESKEPDQFAISLIGEPTLYPKLGQLIQELRNKGKSSFLVTNGLYPKTIVSLQKNNQMPTQIYLSLNSPNKKIYEKWHKSQLSDAWEKFNKSLEVMANISTRTVIRITLVKENNMIEPKNYADLIKKAEPNFVEIKSFMSVGFSRKRLGYDFMPSHKETKEFAKDVLKYLPEYKMINEHERSRVVLLSNGKKESKICKKEY